MHDNTSIVVHSFIVALKSTGNRCFTPNLNIKTTMSDNPYYSRTDTAKLNVDDEEWKKILDEEVFYIARKKGTERAFSGKYWDFEGIGTYYCAVCGNKLLSLTLSLAVHAAGRVF